MFWGITIEHGKIYSQVVQAAFQVSMASLEPQPGLNEFVGLNIVHCKQEYLLCTLQHGVLHQQPLALKFCEGEEISFFTTGPGVVHLTGFHWEGDSLSMHASRVRLLGELDESSEMLSIEDSDEGSDEDSEDDEEENPSLSLLTDELITDSEDDDDWHPKGDNQKKTSPKNSMVCKKKKLKVNQLTPYESSLQSSKEAKKKPNIKEAAIEIVNSSNTSKSKARDPIQSNGWTAAAGGCKYRDLLVGHGPAARKGATAHIYYEGKNIKGEVFESGKTGKPYQLKLGSKSFLVGLHHGIQGMRVGGKRKIIIPPSQGYGQNGLKGKVPGNSRVYFVVELKAVSS